MSCKTNLLHEVVGRISFMYAMETLSAVLVFSGTVIKDVSKQMNVKANLFPLDIVDSCPLESIAQLENGICEISRCIGCV